jgi:hypothetical protein
MPWENMKRRRTFIWTKKARERDEEKESEKERVRAR